MVILLRFLKVGIPYRIIGGIKFYERAEIKDCVAYLKCIHQPMDDLSFERIINIPKRSVGDTTIKNISEFAKKNDYSLEVSSKKLIELNKIKPKTKIGLNSFLKSSNGRSGKIRPSKSHFKIFFMNFS